LFQKQDKKPNKKLNKKEVSQMARISLTMNYHYKADRFHFAFQHNVEEANHQEKQRSQEQAGQQSVPHP
jgi:hypothetical protein